MIGIIITMKTLAEELAEKFGIPIEEAKEIVGQVVKDERSRGLNEETRRGQIRRLQCRLETPALFVANEITKKPVQ
jgi:argininosuccinate lyase